jgi:ABC-type branched-subunit amino acid transport system ATPase component
VIESAEFHNFKGLRDVRTGLERFTVLVGPNASGKTSILEGLHFLSQLATKPPVEFFTGIRRLDHLYHRSSQGDLELQFSGPDGCLRVRATPPGELLEEPEEPGSPESPVTNWVFQMEGKPPREQQGSWRRIEEVWQGLRQLRSAVFLRLDASRLAAISYSPYSPPRVAFNGEGLPSVLAYMKLSREREFQQLLTFLKRIIPTIENVRVERVPYRRTETELITIGSERLPHRTEREYMGEAIVFDVKGADSVPAPLMSEGTLLVLGLLAVMLGPVRPRLILLDDLEQGLHPRAQQELIALLRELLAQRPEMQIVATTHSPYLLDSMKADEVRLTALKEDGSVACARMTDHPEFEKWKAAMLPGEFWSLIGEKWVAEPRAQEVGA